MIDQGQYGDWIAFAPIGNLARTDPDGDSPLIPGFTNMQAAMFFAAGPIFGTFEFHYFGGIWENDFPVDLQYVTKDQCFDFLEAAVPWEAARFIMDYSNIIADVTDTPFDDHLGAITVPILNVAPAGGCGDYTKYTTTLLGSTDITHLIPSLHSADQAMLDTGHIDIFTATVAQSLVWQPILAWIILYIQIRTRHFSLRILCVSASFVIFFSLDTPCDRLQQINLFPFENYYMYFVFMLMNREQ